MIVVFAGPSLPQAMQTEANIAYRGPAALGDMVRAVDEGARVIGLIDGVFEHQPTVWHKEVLWCLAQGVAVLGGASMGALRALECDAFGMVGVGRIYDGYRAGRWEDDSAVAQIHAPAELGHRPLTEALVNVDFTLDAMASSGALTAEEIARLRAAAAALFFKDRTWAALAAAADWRDAAGRAALLDALRAHAVDQKRADANAVVAACAVAEPAGPRPWTLSETSYLDGILNHAR